MRESGFGFLAYFENHEKRMEKLLEVGSGIMDEIKSAEGKIAKQQSEIDRVEGQPESKKVKAIRKKGPKRIRKYQRRICELEVNYEVGIQAWNNGFFQYCQVAYDVWAKNSLFHGNNALGLYVGELNMRSPYGEIDTKMMKQVAKTNVVKAQLERMAQEHALEALREPADQGAAGDSTKEDEDAKEGVAIYEEGADNSAKEGEAERKGAAVGGQGDGADASAT